MQFAVVAVGFPYSGALLSLSIADAYSPFSHHIINSVKTIKDLPGTSEGQRILSLLFVVPILRWTLSSKFYIEFFYRMTMYQGKHIADITIHTSTMPVYMRTDSQIPADRVRFYCHTFVLRGERGAM